MLYIISIYVYTLQNRNTADNTENTEYLSKEKVTYSARLCISRTLDSECTPRRSTYIYIVYISYDKKRTIEYVVKPFTKTKFHISKKLNAFSIVFHLTNYMPQNFPTPIFYTYIQSYLIYDCLYNFSNIAYIVIYSVKSMLIGGVLAVVFC